MSRTPAPRGGYLSGYLKKIGPCFLKFIIGGLSAVLVVGFSAGTIWAQFLQYEQRVNEHGELITNIQRDIRVFKRNLQEMGDPKYSYLVEVTGDNHESWRCERGSVVTGIDTMFTTTNFGCAARRWGAQRTIRMALGRMISGMKLRSAS